MQEVYLLLGSNLGERTAFLNLAIVEVGKRIGPVLLSSSIFETEAWGDGAGGPYLNQAIMVKTAMTPEAVLKEIHQIEAQAGRVRRVRWEPRNLDIDIAFFGQHVVRQPNLTIPHPRLVERKFALIPLCEIAANFVHPVLQKPLSSLRDSIDDHREVSIFTFL